MGIIIKVGGQSELVESVLSIPAGGTSTVISRTVKLDSEAEVYVVIDPFNTLTDPDRTNNTHR